MWKEAGYFPLTMALFKARAFPSRDTNPCNKAVVTAEVPGPSHAQGREQNEASKSMRQEMSPSSSRIPSQGREMPRAGWGWLLAARGQADHRAAADIPKERPGPWCCWILRAPLGVGQAGCHIPGTKSCLGRLQHLARVPVLFMEVFPSWAELCPEAEEATEAPVAPLQALSCCRTMLPAQPLPPSAEPVAGAPGAGRTRSGALLSCQTGAGFSPCPSVL